MARGATHFQPSIGNDVSARPSREAGAGEVPPAALAPAISDDAELVRDLPAFQSLHNSAAQLANRADRSAPLFAFIHVSGDTDVRQ